MMCPPLPPCAEACKSPGTGRLSRPHCVRMRKHTAGVWLLGGRPRGAEPPRCWPAPVVQLGSSGKAESSSHSAHNCFAYLLRVFVSPFLAFLVNDSETRNGTKELRRQHLEWFAERTDSMQNGTFARTSEITRPNSDMSSVWHSRKLRRCEVRLPCIRSRGTTIPRCGVVHRVYSSTRCSTANSKAPTW